MGSNRNKRIDISVDFTTEFGAAVKVIKVVPGEDAESTFKNVLNIMPKYISRTWEAVEFPFENQNFQVCKRWLVETNWCFNKSFLIID